MVLNIIMAVCLMPVPLILFIVMRNEAAPKKNIVLGVTLPKDAREDARVLTIAKRFKIWQAVVFVILVGLMIPPFFLQHETVVLMWDFIWILVAIVLPNVPFLAANRQLTALKRQNNWYGESTGVTLVDMKLALTQKKPLSVLFFLPTIILSLVPVVQIALTLNAHDDLLPMMLIYGSFTVILVVNFFLYRAICHQRAEVVDENTTVNAALTQVRRYNWSKSWLMMAWLTWLFDWAVWLADSNGMAIIIGSLIYTVVLLIVLMSAEFKTRRVQQKLTAESGQTVYTDDDDHWYMGMFYYNPSDSHTMVNRRTGMGTTMNMAKTSSKVLMVVTALLLLSMPGLGIVLMNMEKTPVQLEVSVGQITARHGGTDYTINDSDIRNAYLLEKLPDGTRTNGTAMESVLKGSFKLHDIGPCRLCLDPRTPPFVVIETAQRTYVFGASNKDETRTVINALQDRGLLQVKPAA